MGIFKRCLLLVVGISLLLFLTSCWNSRELNELAIVTGIGIDKAAENDEYRVTFQVVNPSATVTTSSSGSGLPAITVISASDKTMFGALRKASKRATRQLFFAHAQLVIVGEPLAREGISELFDIFERSHEIRMNSGVLVAKNTDAAAVMKILTPVDSLPSIGILRKTENASKLWGENRTINVFDLINDISGEADFSINGVSVMGDVEEGIKKSNLDQSEPKTKTIMSGLGVFKEGKLRYWMEGPEARGTQWVLNKIEETNINIDSPGKERNVAVNVFYSRTKIKIEIRDGKPVFHINIREEGIINEVGSYVDLGQNEEIIKLENELEKQTEAEVRQAIQTAQSMKSDVFNFGNQLKRERPEYWKKVKTEWDALFAQTKVEINVEAFIRGTGMRLKPYIPANE